jgi:hypothetical protein
MAWSTSDLGNAGGTGGGGVGNFSPDDRYRAAGNVGGWGEFATAANQSSPAMNGGNGDNTNPYTDANPDSTAFGGVGTKEEQIAELNARARARLQGGDTEAGWELRKAGSTFLGNLSPVNLNEQAPTTFLDAVAFGVKQAVAAGIGGYQGAGVNTVIDTSMQRKKAYEEAAAEMQGLYGWDDETRDDMRSRANAADLSRFENTGSLTYGASGDPLDYGNGDSELLPQQTAQAQQQTPNTNGNEANVTATPLGDDLNKIIENDPTQYADAIRRKLRNRAGFLSAMYPSNETNPFGVVVPEIY